jgi:hypothetical protein
MSGLLQPERIFVAMKPRARTLLGDPVTSCHMPQKADLKESELYLKLHDMNCDRRGEPGHKCAGRVMIDSNGVTLSCPLCGDLRKTFDPEAKRA